MELAPQETRVFEVKVRNKWEVPRERIAALETRATNILVIAKESGRFKSVEASLQDMLRDLDALRAAPAPAPVSTAAARYRDSVTRLNEVERKLVRIEDLLKSKEPPTIEQQLGQAFKIAAPEKRTTWIIIYCILIFLGVLSLLFFLRWHGRSKAEKVETE